MKEQDRLYNELRLSLWKDYEKSKNICNRIKNLPLEQQIEIIDTPTNNFKNLLLRSCLLVNEGDDEKPFCLLLDLVKNFPKEVIINLFKSNKDSGCSILWYLLQRPYDFPLTCIRTVCDIIKTLPLDKQINLFTYSHLLFNEALKNVYYYRNPLGFSNSLIRSPDVSQENQDKKIKAQNDSYTYLTAEQKSHAYFTAIVEPLLDIMKNFPVHIKEKIFNNIPNSYWFLNRFSNERLRIKNAIGVKYPFTPPQKLLFTISAGAGVTGAGMWVLMATSAITGSSFAVIAWPLAITLMIGSAVTMLGVRLYARNKNLAQEYQSCENISSSRSFSYDSL